MEDRVLAEEAGNLVALCLWTVHVRPSLTFILAFSLKSSVKISAQYLEGVHKHIFENRNIDNIFAAKTYLVELLFSLTWGKFMGENKQTEYFTEICLFLVVFNNLLLREEHQICVLSDLTRLAKVVTVAFSGILKSGCVWKEIGWQRGGNISQSLLDSPKWECAGTVKRGCCLRGAPLHQPPYTLYM